MQATGEAIRVERICKRFGDVSALDNVSLSIPKGGIFALLGPNGAGKTTLIKIMTTLLPPDAGSVTVGGFDVVEHPRRVRSIIGLAGQFAAVDDHLTGRENLAMVARLYHMGRKEARVRTGQILAELDLLDAADRQSKTYSGGMRRRLDLGASFIINPQILFLDEPTNGLDPRGRAELWKVIRQLVVKGTTLLLTTQNLEEAEELADRIAIIDRGRVIADGTAAELKARIGGSVLEFRLPTGSDLDEAAAVTGELFAAAPSVEEEIMRISGPVDNRGSDLTEVVRRLDRAGIAISDIHLRKPTMNEVFLKLTGQGMEE